MVLAADVDDVVAQGLVAVERLDNFLQATLGIFLLKLRNEALVDGTIDAEHDAAGGGQVAVEVEGANHRLEGVLEGGGAAAAAALFLAGAEEQAVIEADLAGEAAKALALGESGAALAQGALPIRGKALEKRIGQDHLQHGVPQKFQPLVALGLRGVLLQIGRMRHRPNQQGRVSEGVVKADLEGFELFETIRHGSG